MNTCEKCGKTIQYVTIDGIVRPMHSCLERERSIFRKFENDLDFCNPNALCPVCKKPVFYYSNSSGSRVFFEFAGIPWDKHPCTDNGEDMRPTVLASVNRILTDKDGNDLDFFTCRRVFGFYKGDGFKRSFFQVQVESKNGFKNYFFCLADQDGVNWNSLSISGGFFRRVIDRKLKRFKMHFLNRETDQFSTAYFTRNEQLVDKLKKLSLR